MVHIQNMEYSLLAVQSLFKLNKSKGIPLPDLLCYRCGYDFLDTASYLLTVKEHLLTKSDKIRLNKHLDIAKFIIGEYADTEKTTIDKLFYRFYPSYAFPVREIYKLEERWNKTSDARFSIIQTDWTGDYLPPNTDIEIAEGEDLWIYSIGKKELYEKVNEVMKGLEFLLNDVDTSKETDNTQPPPITIPIPENILNDLQQAGFIENATERPLKWLQNKQLARELLTHDKIKGSLSVTEIEKRTPYTFIDNNGNSLKLAKPKKKDIDPNHKRLMKILATL